MMSRLKLFIPFIIFIVLAAFFWRGLSLDPTEMPSALIDKTFPEFSLPSLADENNSLTREDLLGQVSLVNVWATWCAACKFEHPVLNTLADQGVAIIGINYKDNTSGARKWLDELGDPYQMTIVDTRGSLGIDLGVFGAPETYVVDKKGVIRHKHVGIVNMQVWNESLEPLYKQLAQE